MRRNPRQSRHHRSRHRLQHGVGGRGQHAKADGSGHAGTVARPARRVNRRRAADVHVGERKPPCRSAKRTRPWKTASRPAIRRPVAASPAPTGRKNHPINATRGATDRNPELRPPRERNRAPVGRRAQARVGQAPNRVIGWVGEPASGKPFPSPPFSGPGARESRGQGVVERANPCSRKPPTLVRGRTIRRLFDDLVATLRLCQIEFVRRRQEDINLRPVYAAEVDI